MTGLSDRANAGAGAHRRWQYDPVLRQAGLNAPARQRLEGGCNCQSSVACIIGGTDAFDCGSR